MLRRSTRCGESGCGEDCVGIACIRCRVLPCGGAAVVLADVEDGDAAVNIGVNFGGILDDLHVVGVLGERIL